MLWIALYLPQLPLQLAQRAQQTINPCVVSDGPALRPLVLCANHAARELGVLPGMPVAAARAIAGEFIVFQRDEAAEAHALHNLGCWAYQFTPGIVLQTGEGLILDVGSTLKLHGGLKKLITRIHQSLTELGYHAEPGVAPTPLAAWLLAKARCTGIRVRMCTDITLLRERLSTLPLALLDWPDEIMKPLQTLGILRIGQCLQLPRDGFIRRFGYARQLELDKMLGIAPDPRPCFLPPEKFANRIEFGFEINDALMLLFPLKRLLQELAGFLRGRGAGVQEWHLLLDHMNKGKTHIVMGVISPERNAERFLALARERLTQMTLIGPVLALGIAADQLLIFEESNRSFIPDPRTRAIGWGHLVDKLTTRLGNEKVYRLRALDDHRPEHAWQQNTAAVAKKSSTPRITSPRPLFLLKTPRVLSTDEGDPLCQGRLRLLAGPERIESGWWDGNTARRDYFVARNPKGETFWIYREHQRSPLWYLHGIFS
ncbi:MAG: DNA polymerase Y family protein [Pseudomonadota bacterium]